MPRPRKADAAPPAKLSGGQASYVLERLLKERRVNQTEVNRYVGEMKREIGELEERLKNLRDAVGDAASAAVSGIASAASNAMAVVRGRRGRPAGSKNKPGRPPGRPAGTGRKPGRPPKAAAATAAAPAEGAATGAKRGRKKSAITAEQLASRQLQGRYLALVRRFPASKRAGFAKTAKDKGREAAIKEMQDSLPKK
jgi:hypothetical protein